MKSLYNILKNIAHLEKTPLVEGVEYVTDKNGDRHHFRDNDVENNAFGIVNDVVLFSKNNDTHGNMIMNYFNLNKNGILDYEAFDKIYKSMYYSGRIWSNFKLISFWNSYVPQGIIYDIQKALTKQYPNEDTSNYEIEYGKK